MLKHNDDAYLPRRIVCVTIVPAYGEAEYKLDPSIETKLITLLAALGPNCRVSKFQWLVATDEASGGISQDLVHEGVENVLVFSALVGTDWKFCCSPKGLADDWEFDGIGSFLQRQLGS
jgi:hypothetical protein